MTMRCPICDSDNYNFIEVDGFNKDNTRLRFKCLGKCGKEFIGVYEFYEFEDSDGNTIDE